MSKITLLISNVLNFREGWLKALYARCYGKCRGRYSRVNTPLVELSVLWQRPTDTTKIQSIVELDKW